MLFKVLTFYRSAVKEKMNLKEQATKFEPFINRYRRETKPINPEKSSCTLQMRVSGKERMKERANE